MINRDDKVIATKDISYSGVFIPKGSISIVTDYCTHGSGRCDVYWSLSDDISEETVVN